MTDNEFIRYFKRYAKESNHSVQWYWYTFYIQFGIAVNPTIYGYAQYYYNTRHITYYGHEYTIPVDTDGKITYETFKDTMDFLVKEFDKIYF